MLTEYSISDIVLSHPKNKSYYIGRFADTESPDLDWPHRHDFYSIVWFTNGTGTNVIDFDAYEIKPNRFFLMHLKQIHNWSYSKDVKGYMLLFDKLFINDFPVELMNIPYFDFNNDDILLLKPQFETLVKEAKYNDALSEKSVLFGAKFLFQQLIRLSTQSNEHLRIQKRPILYFSEQITHHISENLSVQDYADKLRISVKKLNELCKEKYELSPKSFILDKKITEAKRLLYYTTLSIQEISFKLGFVDSSYFSRVFKQLTQFSPSDFRAKTPK
jgi:AraC family transcriptional activator of pobA